MAKLFAAVLLVAACHGPAAEHGDAAALDVANSDVAKTDAPMCEHVSGTYPRAIPLTAGANGVGDASFALDPNGVRTWMSYSSVAPGPGDFGLVSTRLAYTDDGGTTFCDAGEINAAAAIATPPTEFAGIATFWNHEVSTLIYDPFAPADEAWRLEWQRYLIANTGAADERQFQYSWIEERRAASPLALAAASEHKLFAGAGYASTPEVQAYNDGVLGPPEIQFAAIDPALADCAVLTEPGLIATTSARWLALACGTGDPATSRIVLVSDPRTGSWQYVSRLLGETEAQHINAGLTGFGAPALFSAGGATYLLATPTAGETYLGCIEYQLTLPAGSLVDANSDGQPDPVRTTMGSGFSGACAYDASLGANGFVMLQADVAVSPPTFALLETGVTP